MHLILTQSESFNLWALFIGPVFILKTTFRKWDLFPASDVPTLNDPLERGTSVTTTKTVDNVQNIKIYS
jgi:hypothetical protein